MTSAEEVNKTMFLTMIIAITLLCFLYWKHIKPYSHRQKKMIPLILSLGAMLVTISTVKYPDDAFKAALQGLDVWFNIVFPALLPFFIGSQLLMGLGVVHFMGVLLEPFMRPLFNVPGIGSFVMAMGLASGYPIGAMLTGELRRQNLISKTEAERLMSFTNTADPLFMIGAVAVGMFKNVAIGGIITASHYISCILVGFALKFYKPKSNITKSLPGKGSIILKAFKEMFKAREKDGRPFGQLLGDCVRDSVNAMLLICGYIIIFSVITRMLGVIGAIDFLSTGISQFLNTFGISGKFTESLIGGTFEITLGTQLTSQVTGVNLTQKVMVASAIIAWSGLSVHAQVASMVSETDISLIPYIFARILHAVLAAFISWVIMEPAFNVFSQISMPVFSMNIYNPTQPIWFDIFKLSTETFSVVIITIISISFLIHALKNLKVIKLKIINRH
jgi:sporulation integral membrane protein YlbJ